VGNTGRPIVLFPNTINIDLIEVKCDQFHKFSLVCIKKLQWSKLNSLSKQFTSVNKFVSRGVEWVRTIYLNYFFPTIVPLKLGMCII